MRSHTSDSPEAADFTRFIFSRLSRFWPTRAAPFKLSPVCTAPSLQESAYPSLVLALVHAAYAHATPRSSALVVPFVRERLRPLVRTEAQFIYVLHFVGPLLQRLAIEKTRSLIEVYLDFSDFHSLSERKSNSRIAILRSFHYSIYHSHVHISLNFDST